MSQKAPIIKRDNVYLKTPENPRCGRFDRCWKRGEVLEVVAVSIVAHSKLRSRKMTGLIEQLVRERALVV